MSVGVLAKYLPLPVAAVACTVTATGAQSQVRDAVGLFQNGHWFLDANNNRQWDGPPGDIHYIFGVPGDVPVVGDWSGDGITKIGVFRSGHWYLDYNGNGTWDGPFLDRVHAFGKAGDKPVVGVWTAGGRSRIGIYRDGLWYLDINGNGIWDGVEVDRLYGFGTPTDTPVTGDWNGTGTTKIGVFRRSDPSPGYYQTHWFIDMNGDGQWQGTPTDRLWNFPAFFGYYPGLPVTGDWDGAGRSKLGYFFINDSNRAQWLIDINGDGTCCDYKYPGDGSIYFGGPGQSPVIGKTWR